MSRRIWAALVALFLCIIPSTYAAVQEQTEVCIEPTYFELLGVPLAKGDTGEEVFRLQERLHLLNYLSAPADGSFGVNTDAALRLFQTSVGFPVTGVADTNTQRALFDDDAPVSPKPAYTFLGYGSNSDAVKDVKRALALTGFYTGNITSNYDSVTARAVKALVRHLNLLGYDFHEDGNMPHDLQTLLLDEGIPVFAEILRRSDSGAQVTRLQNRLFRLNYLSVGDLDGIFGAKTENAVKSFQRRNLIEQTGIADLTTQLLLFSEEAVSGPHPYRIKVRLSEQKVYVYGHDENDFYNQLIKTMVCSSGLPETPTPVGTFTRTGPGARWHYFKSFSCWAQYAFTIDGDILFHSVLYSEKDEKTLRQGTVSALGRPASHGCIRLSVEDARWLYVNCSAGTTVEIY